MSTNLLVNVCLLMNFTGSFQFCRARPNFKVTAATDHCHGQFSSSFAVLQPLPRLEGHATDEWGGGGGWGGGGAKKKQL